MARRILIAIIILCYCILVAELIKKNIFAASYYNLLSNTNTLRKTTVPAPRGVFYDRNGILLAKNMDSKTTTSKRNYPQNETFAHLIGYMSLPGEQSIKDITCGSKALSNQPVGAYGLEKTFECRLRGKPGSSYELTDASGKEMQTYALDPPQKGETITLSLDVRLQEIAARAMKEKKGTVIASDPQTGEFFVLYSSPSFNANKLMTEKGAYGKYVADEAQPLFNRFTSGTYPPGSVIKPALALFALHDGVITTETVVEDTGIFELGGVKFGNWYYLQYGKKDGEVNVVRALAHSNDIFFYKLGLSAGIDTIASWLHTARYDETDLSSFFPQTKGLLPNARWKKDTLGDQWYLGDTVNMSIGQGYVQVNPTQVHASMSIIANKGTWCPYQVEKGKKDTCTEVLSHNEEWKPLFEGMVQACSEGGTGYPLFSFSSNGKKIPIACKTGTAESQQKATDPHAWFTAFAPANNPQILITVLVENGGEGSSVAAPIAKEILTAFFAN